ncbi:hypothetical protein GCM10010156_62030 [Planobispora rosea]|uniref:Uncharacterized protein n=1 Tax=Planobispora rosea TaxID=35762 RepID=A0A8J3S499_PLARO|nr:hypothetical protein [Planobispora rosea]GGS95373.1 hypothetical protein GCM10010156_62030 [Planobispora rosea]GIH87532.1 hypothetical protein Pro02_59400 [Planobispora rosea]
MAVEVRDDGGRPTEGAEVSLYGVAFTAYTGAEGRAELAVPPDALASVRALVVRPPRGCWPAMVNQPLLNVDAPSTVTCLRITETHPGFPDQQLDSWGTRAMGFDRLPPTHRGHGVRIAVIASGVVGLTPEAEVYGCRVAPEGTTLDLVEALDYCIEQRIDVALIAYGFPGHSPWSPPRPRKRAATGWCAWPPPVTPAER